MRNHVLKTSRTIGVLLLTILIASVATAGPRNIDETRKVAADASIDVGNLAGSITIVGWDKKEVKITGRLDEKAKELVIKGDENDLSIHVKYPKKIKGGINKGTVLEIKVPRGCDLELAGVSTDIDVSDFRGDLEIQTVSGGIDVKDDPSEIEIESVSGEIYVLSATKVAEVSSVSGTIVVKGIKESLEISVVSGDVEVEARTLSEFSFNSVSGGLDMTASPTSNADWEFSCHSGDLSLRLPDDLDASFDIDLFSGDVRNDFGPKAKRTDKYGPGKELHFSAGDGSANIDISMFSGEVRLIKN